MEWLDGDVSAFQASLEKTPEVFAVVGMRCAIDVSYGVIYDLVREFIEVIVRLQRVSIHYRSRFHVLAKQFMKVSFATRANNFRTNLSAALQHGGDNRLAIRAATVNLFRPLVGVHEPRLAADESLISLDMLAFAAKFVERLALGSQANPLQHEPCRLLRNAKPAMQFIGTDAVLAIQKHPCSRKPLLKGDGAVLENGASLERERRTDVTRVALPDPPLFKVSDFLSAARRALHDAIRPAELDHELTAILELREVQNCVPKSSVCAHEFSVRSIAWDVKYIIIVNLEEGNHSHDLDPQTVR